jgi:hypothetical protein
MWTSPSCSRQKKKLVVFGPWPMQEVLGNYLGCVCDGSMRVWTTTRSRISDGTIQSWSGTRKQVHLTARRFNPTTEFTENGSDEDNLQGKKVESRRKKMTSRHLKHALSLFTPLPASFCTCASVFFIFAFQPVFDRCGLRKSSKFLSCGVACSTTLAICSHEFLSVPACCAMSFPSRYAVIQCFLTNSVVELHGCRHTY